MFWCKKKKPDVSELLKKARRYVHKTIQPSKPESSTITSQEVHGEVRYSLRGGYNPPAVDSTIKDYFRNKKADYASALSNWTEDTFVERVQEIIRNRKLKDSAIYKAAQIDRRLFSKMMSDSRYKPSKDTAIAIAFALNLSMEDASDLLARAGYTLSHSSERDIIIEYFFMHRRYNLIEINLVLEEMGQKIIGR